MGATPHGVYYVGTYRRLSETESNGYKNCQVLIVRDDSDYPDKLDVKIDSDVYKFLKTVERGQDVRLTVIPPRRARSKSGSVYVKAAYVVDACLDD